MANNFPTIRPSLNLQFANTGVLPPDVTFTRASSSGGYYDGVTVSKAEENLLLRSQDYSATWTVTNLTPVTGKTAPNGTSTATEFTAGGANAVLTQGYTAIAGSYTFSVFLRRVTGSGDIEIAADNGTFTVKVITGTWARYDVTQTVAAGSKVAGVRVVTSGDVIEVWGAQLEQRSSVTAYTPTTTQPITNYIPKMLFAPANVPVFDHNPVTGEALGLSVWEARTNLAVRSQEYDNASWTKTRSSISANQLIAPDGTLTADKFIEDASVSLSHVVNQDVSVSASTTYTGTVYFKASERTWAYINLIHVGTASYRSWFNLSSGAVGTSDAGNTATITSVGNGWYRARVSRATAAGQTSIRFEFGLATGDGTVTYTGDGYSGIYIWGAQLEAGAFATPYVPTVASTVARSADVAVMTGVNFSRWYNQAEGSLVAEWKRNVGAGIGVDINAGSSANVLVLSGDVAGTSTALVIKSNNFQFFSSTGSNDGSSQKVSAAYKTNDFAFSYRGGAVATDTSGELPNTMVQLSLSGNGYIKSIQYYPARLTNSNLVAITG